MLITDGIFGEVLFWTLRKVLGGSTYTYEVHCAWVKLYNRMLQFIMPVAVALEVDRGGPADGHYDRLSMHDLDMFPHSVPRLLPSSQDFGEEEMMEGLRTEVCAWEDPELSFNGLLLSEKVRAQSSAAFQSMLLTSPSTQRAPTGCPIHHQGLTSMSASNDSVVFLSNHRCSWA